MAVYTIPRLATEVLEAFGIDPSLAMSWTLTCTPDDVPTLTVEFYADLDKAGEVVTAVKRYRLEEIPTEGEAA